MAKLNFVSVEQQRKYQKSEQKTRRRLLWELKRGYRKPTSKKMLNVGRGHKAQIEDLKRMNIKLIKVSSVDMVFVSHSSTSKQSFADRDRTDPTHVPKTSGNTQDLLRLLSTASKPIAIVAIDFAGLATNAKNLIQWLR